MGRFGRISPHKTKHQDAGADEINVQALSGELADEQKSAWTKVSGKPSTFAPSAHKTSHQDKPSTYRLLLHLLVQLGNTPPSSASVLPG